jgi:hypothetical protein
VSALCLGSAFGFMGGVVFSRAHLFGHGGPSLFDHGRRGPRRGGPGGPDEHGVPSPGRLVAHLQRMLALTPAQATAVRGEIERTRGEFATVRDSLHERIARHLTPEQRERWRSEMRNWNPGEPRGHDPRTLRAEPGREGDPTR